MASQIRLLALSSIVLFGCGDDRIVYRDDGLPSVVNVDDLEPIAEELFPNGGLMAASQGWTYVWDSSGNSSSPDAIHRVGADGTVDFDWIVEGYGRPHVSRSGQLWTVGTRDLIPTSLGQEQRIDAFELETGEFVESVFLSTEEPMRMTALVERPDGDLLVGTSSTATGVRLVTSPEASEKLIDGFGNNSHLGITSGGTLLIGSGHVFGRWLEEFEILLWATDLSVRAILTMPDGATVVVNEGYAKWFSRDFSQSRIIVETNLGRAFKSGAFDEDAGELVLLTFGGSLYRIPYGDLQAAR